MKKNIFTLAAILFASFTLFSCSSDKDDVETSKDLLGYPYSTLSEADQKLKLAAEGEATMKQMEALPTEASVKLLSSFNGISQNLFSLLGETPETDALRAVTKLSKYYGEYEWDAPAKVWNKTEKEVTDKLVAIFPATKTSKTNDGKIEVTATAITSTVEINGHEIPSNVVAQLFVAAKKEGEITAIATGISESTYVETADITTTLGAYKLVLDVDKKGSKNDTNLEFAKGNDIIIKAVADLEATITAEMLSNEDVSTVKDANAVVNIAKELAAAGYVDGKSLLPELKRIEDAQEALYEKYPWNSGKQNELEKESLDLEKEKIEALNKYSNLALVSTTETYKIAKITFDLEIIDKWEYTEFVYEVDKDGNIMEDEDGNLIVKEEITVTYYETKEIAILNFNDETKVNADVFFGEGFSKVLKMWNNIISQFN